MKKILLVPVIAVMALSACTQLSDKDRAYLDETHTLAQQAKEEADAARADADRAARAAQAASAKADKIFREGQNK